MTKIIQSSNFYNIMLDDIVYDYIIKHGCSVYYHQSKLSLIVKDPKQYNKDSFTTFAFAKTTMRHYRKNRLMNCAGPNRVFDFTKSNYKGDVEFSDMILNDMTKNISNSPKSLAFDLLTEEELSFFIKYLDLLSTKNQVESSDMFRNIEQKLK